MIAHNYPYKLAFNGAQLPRYSNSDRGENAPSENAPYTVGW